MRRLLLTCVLILGLATTGHAATFPAITNIVLTAAAACTSCVVNIGSPLVDQLVFVFVSINGNTTISWPGGWTELQADATDGDSQVTTSAGYKVAAGSEGATITITLGASQTLAATAYVIVNYTGTPEAGTAVGTAAGVPSTAPDPPLLTPAGGSADYLWLACAGTDNGAALTTAFVADRGTGGFAETRTGAGVGDAAAMCEIVWATAASRDPAAFTISASQEWVANTFSVKGAAAAGTTVNPCIISRDESRNLRRPVAWRGVSPLFAPVLLCSKS